MYGISPYIGRPTVTSLGVDQAAINEGGTVTLSGAFLDAVYQDTAAVTVLWGDGQSDTLHLDAGASTFSASHRYLDNRPGDAPYTIDVTVLDDGGGSTNGGTAVTVLNAAPTVAVAGPAGGGINHALTFTADIADAGTLDSHSTAWEVRDPRNAVIASGTGPTLNFTPPRTGSYTVSLSVTDDDGASSTASQTVRVTRVGIGYGCADPTALLVVGTAGADTIRVEPKGTAGDVKVLLNGVNKGSFPAASFTSIVLEGLGGGDVLKVASGISKPAFLFGGAGNDQLRGGAGPSVLVGAYGQDVLNGGTGRNVLIGGFQADRLIGLGEEDVLIAGNVTFEANGAALAAVLAEWRSERDYPTRIANLRGEGSGPRENEEVFLSALGGNATVLEDAAQDTLKGGAGLDWFFAHPDAPFRDVLADRLDTETLDERG